MPDATGKEATVDEGDARRGARWRRYRADRRAAEAIIPALTRQSPAGLRFRGICASAESAEPFSASTSLHTARKSVGAAGCDLLEQAVEIHEHRPAIPLEQPRHAFDDQFLEVASADALPEFVGEGDVELSSEVELWGDVVVQQQASPAGVFGACRFRIRSGRLPDQFDVAEEAGGRRGW